jgi:hypothetical protein
MKWNIRKLSLIVLMFFLISSIIINSSCGNPSYSTPLTSQQKVNSLLKLQVSLRLEQVASPTQERLAQMQAQGMNVTDLNIERLYIYLKQQLTQTQINDLQALGITIYLNSWVPPAGNNPDGFYLADMPIAKLDQLAAKDNVVRLDTAERQLQPQGDLQ